MFVILLIVNTVATILAGVLLLRFWMQAIRVRPPQSLSHFMYSLSDWLVLPMRRVIPGIGGYDWASLIGAFLIIVLSVSVMFIDGYTYAMVAKLALHRFLSWILYGFIVLLIAEAIFSWVNPHAPLAPFVRALNEPLLRHLRRVVPLVGGIDLSMLVALILLQIALYYLGAIFGIR